jgi:hypothetical protein
MCARLGFGGMGGLRAQGFAVEWGGPDDAASTATGMGPRQTMHAPRAPHHLTAPKSSATMAMAATEAVMAWRGGK